MGRKVERGKEGQRKNSVMLRLSLIWSTLFRNICPVLFVVIQSAVNVWILLLLILCFVFFLVFFFLYCQFYCGTRCVLKCDLACPFAFQYVACLHSHHTRYVRGETLIGSLTYRWHIELIVYDSIKFIHKQKMTQTRVIQMQTITRTTIPWEGTLPLHRLWQTMEKGDIQQHWHAFAHCWSLFQFFSLPVLWCIFYCSSFYFVWQKQIATKTGNYENSTVSTSWYVRLFNVLWTIRTIVVFIILFAFRYAFFSKHHSQRCH